MTPTPPCPNQSDLFGRVTFLEMVPKVTKGCDPSLLELCITRGMGGRECWVPSALFMVLGLRVG